MRTFFIALLLSASARASARADLTNAVERWRSFHPGSPFLALVGDSRMQGYTNYTTAAFGGGTESGNTNGDVGRRIWINSGQSGVLWTTNYGYSGAGPSFNNNQIVNTAIPTKPKYIGLLTGANFIRTTGTWAGAVSVFNTTLASCQASNVTLIISEEWPDSTVSPVSKTLNWNSEMSLWVSSNSTATVTNAGGIRPGVVLLRSHAYVDTGNGAGAADDAIYPTWTFDGEHPTLTGTDQWSLLWLSALEGMEAATNIMLSGKIEINGRVSLQ